jgi:hypothetical protein
MHAKGGSSATSAGLIGWLVAGISHGRYRIGKNVGDESLIRTSTRHSRYKSGY